MYISNRDIIPGFVETISFCKAPLWGGRLDLDSPNLTPRFAHRLPLLLRLVVVKKRPRTAPCVDPILDLGVPGGTHVEAAIVPGPPHRNPVMRILDLDGRGGVVVEGT